MYTVWGDRTGAKRRNMCLFRDQDSLGASRGGRGGGERAARDVYSCAEVATCSVFEVLGGLSTDGSALFFSKQYFKCVCK